MENHDSYTDLKKKRTQVKDFIYLIINEWTREW